MSDRARSKGKKKTSPKQSWEVTFVDCPLSKSDKENIRNLKATHEETFEGLQVLAETEHKLSLSYDPKNDTFIVSATAKGDDDPNLGYCLTARGSTVFDAAIVLLYKDRFILNRVWTSDDDDTDDKMR